MNSLVMWIAGILAAVLAALFAVPILIDWNGYRGVIEEEATRLLGREVRIGGTVNLRLLPTPYLKLEKLRIADTRPFSANPLFRVEEFTLWLSVPPLLKGDIEVRHVALERPEIHLGLDKDGRGSWTGFDVRWRDLPFRPGHVAFQSVEIRNGSVTIEGPSGEELVAVTQIDGEFAAEALSGPMRFAGDVTAGGVRRELRLATAGADEDGSVRFKSTARPKSGSGLEMQLDGRLVALMGAVGLEGDLAMRAPLPQLPGVAGLETAPAERANAGQPAIEVRGRIAAGVERVTLTGLTGSIENVGQPQLLTGEASLQLGPRRLLDVAVTSRWLDLDRLAGSSGRASPAQTLAQLGMGLSDQLPVGADVSGKMSIDLLTLGGEGVSNFVLNIDRKSGEALRIRNMFAGLPAGGRIALDGTMGAAAPRAEVSSGSAGQKAPLPPIDVQTTIQGPSLKRLVHWAAPELTSVMPAVDGPVAFDSRVRLGEGRLAFSDARLELAGANIRGGLSVPTSGEGAVEMTASADRLEWEWLSRSPLTREGALDWLTRIAGSDAGGGDGGVKASPVPSRNVSLKINAAVLRSNDRELHDVFVSADLKDGLVALDRLAFRGGKGLDVAVRGRFGLASPGGGRSAEAGQLDGEIGLADGDAVDRLLELGGVEVPSRVNSLRRLAPMRLATRVRLDARSKPGSADVRVDGAAGGGRVVVDAQLDGGFTNWRANPIELTISTDGVPSSEIIGLLAGTSGVARDRSTLAASTALKAAGIPDTSLVADLAISGPGLSIAYNGRAAPRQDGSLYLDGSAELAADRLSDVLAATASTISARGLDHAVTGSIGLATLDTGALRLTPAGVTVAGAKVDGTLLASRNAEGKPSLSGELSIDRLSVTGLLDGLTVPAASGGGVQAAAAGPGITPTSPPLWAERPFADDALARVEGSVSLAVKRLVLAPELALSDAKLKLAFKPGRIAAELASAKALGGTFSGTVDLAQARAGLAATLALAASGVELASVSRATGGQHAAIGSAAATLNAKGVALGPRGLISSLRGSGSLDLNGVEVEGFLPDAIRQTAKDALERKIGVNDVALAEAIKTRLGQGMLPIGSQRLAIEVADGALTVAPVNIAGEMGRTEVLATVDLATLEAETEWRITADAGNGKFTWPTISAFYVGPLGRIDTVEPRLSLGAFEREVSVRRMEHEVESLERLRREDEERARSERQRLEALAAERARLAKERQRVFEEEQRRQRALQSKPRNPPTIEVVPLPVIPPRSDLRRETTPSGLPIVVPRPAPVVRPAAAGAVPASPVDRADVSSSGVQPVSEVERSALPPADARSSQEPTSQWQRRTQTRRSPSAGETTQRAFDPLGF